MRIEKVLFEWMIEASFLIAVGTMIVPETVLFCISKLMERTRRQLALQRGIFSINDQLYQPVVILRNSKFH